MTESRYYCDGCKKEVPSIYDLQTIELPRAYEDIFKVNDCVSFKSHNVRLKHYEFCKDCWQKIGTFMSMFDDNEWTFDELIDGVLKVAKDMLDKEKLNVN